MSPPAKNLAVAIAGLRGIMQIRDISMRLILTVSCLVLLESRS
ncbi:hypothetical protein [Sphingomonas sp. QA11]|nr:hypothetical protein [Sphingomonas sp. QA11]